MYGCNRYCFYLMLFVGYELFLINKGIFCEIILEIYLVISC